MASVMYNCDTMHGKTSFHPEILALNDKKYLREVLLEHPAIEHKSNMKPFWITDYPILFYVGHKTPPKTQPLNLSQRVVGSIKPNEDGADPSSYQYKRIVIVNLIDKEFPQREFELDDNEHFVSLIDST